MFNAWTSSSYWMKSRSPSLFPSAVVIVLNKCNNVQTFTQKHWHKGFISHYFDKQKSFWMMEFKCWIRYTILWDYMQIIGVIGEWAFDLVVVILVRIWILFLLITDCKLGCGLYGDWNSLVMENLISIGYVFLKKIYKLLKLFSNN